MRQGAEEDRAGAPAGLRAAARVERNLFMRVNDGPDWQWLRVPQQLGTPWALVAAAALLAARGERARAASALVTLPAIKGLEVVVKATVRRPRPLYRVPTELRDDAPVEGGSFPSGHTAIACATAWFVGLACPRWFTAAVWAASSGNAYVRVHQGAHWPTDVAAGAVMGVTAAVCATVVADRMLAVPG